MSYADRHPDATPEQVAQVAALIHDVRSGAHTARRMEQGFDPDAKVPRTTGLPDFATDGEQYPDFTP